MPGEMARAPSERTSLRRRVGVLGLIFVALVVAAVGLATLMVREWDRAVDDRGELRVAAAEVAQLRLAYSDQETGIRGYMLARDPSFLEPYNDGVALAQTMRSRLLAHGATDRSGLDAELDRVERAAQRWTNDAAQPVIAQPSRPIDEVAARARFDDLRRELRDLDSMVARQLIDEMDRTD